GSCFLCFYDEFQSVVQVRCTPKEYGNLAILRVTNDAVSNESLTIGKIANNADADRGFLSEKRVCLSQNEKARYF
ncbi:MAG: hypothetical protein ACI3XQ_10560, partial [Eubacteriales bacterium]